MNDDALLRYSRQILLSEVDIKGQEALIKSKVLVIGLGGLGCPVATYLAGAGVGALILADDDVIDISNLHRQTLYRQTDIGQHKAMVAKREVQAINSDVKVSLICDRFKTTCLRQTLESVDVVVDCTDNFSSRYALNEMSVITGTPLVSGAALQSYGQFAVFNPNDPSAPCYQCVFPKEADEEPQNCTQSGVFGPLVGVVGAWQAMAVIKLLVAPLASCHNMLHTVDVWQMSYKSRRIMKDPTCPVCT